MDVCACAVVVKPALWYWTFLSILYFLSGTGWNNFPFSCTSLFLPLILLYFALTSLILSCPQWRICCFWH